MDTRINWEPRLDVKSGPAKTERVALESELFKLREQHGASLAKALSGGFSPEEEAAHEERVKRMASLVQQLEALDAYIAPRTRDVIVAEITELRKQQLEAATEAVFGGLTREQRAEHQERADRVARLIRELDILDELTGRSA
jgi:hypothetical protein